MASRSSSLTTVRIFDKYFNVQRSKVTNGILSVTRDRTELVRTQLDRDKQTELLKKVMDHAPYGICLYQSVRDAQNNIDDFRLRLCNQQAADITGFTVEEGFKYSVKEMIAIRNHGMELFNACVRVVETGQPFYIEYHALQRSKWIGFSIVKFDDGYLLNYIDITPHKEALLQIERQKKMLDNILTHSASGITVSEVVRDTNGVIVDWKTIVANDAAERFTGLPKTVMLTQTVKQVDPALYDSPATQAALRTLETGEPFVTTVRIEPTDRWLEVSVSRMDPDRFINIFTDVTPLREAQRKLEQSLEELKRSNSNLEQFASMASHDLQEPLRKINVFSGQLRQSLQPMLDGNNLDKFKRIEKAATRMQTLIEDLLAFSHVSRTEEPFVTVDLNRELRGVLEDLDSTVAETAATVTIGDLPTVKGNPSQLRHLFQNLIGNALKYKKPDEPPVVSVMAHRHDGTADGLPYWQLEVSDNGIGFDPEDAERIFGMFQRLHGKSEYSGSGVGLAIARRAAENHGGSITAQSVKGHGATFSVKLPA